MEYGDSSGTSYIEKQVHFPAIPYRAAYSWSRGRHSVDIHVIAPTPPREGSGEHIQHYLPHRNKILFTHFHVSACTVCTVQRCPRNPVLQLSMGYVVRLGYIRHINTNAFVLATVGSALNTIYVYVSQRTNLFYAMPNITNSSLLEEILKYCSRKLKFN